MSPAFITFLKRGGVLLGGSAVVSKVLGLWRDRLFIQTFGQGEQLDVIFTAFRIPDFFFFLLISGTVATLLIPRLKDLSEKQEFQLLSAFLWRLMIGFGIICLIGYVASDYLASWIGKGLSLEAQMEVSSLSKLIFGSVYILSITSVLSAYLQSKERFLALAIGPVVYTLMICLILLVYRNDYGVLTVGRGAITGALLYLAIILAGFLSVKGHLTWKWNPPKKAWKNIYQDFSFRTLNASAFQINQTVDVFIAGFFLAGAVGAFSSGTALGSILLTIVGIPVANSTFPKLTKHKADPKKQLALALGGFRWIWLFCLPVAALGIYFSDTLLELIYGFHSTTLAMATTVFTWTVASLPFMCSIPLLSRIFHAQGNTKTPLLITTISLAIATGLAAYLSFYVFVNDQILGLAIGNFVASTLSFWLYVIALWRNKFWKA